MPRKRDPNKPIKERTKLDTVEQINAELRRTYRLFVNKQITHAEMSRRRELLVALRAGLPDPIERPKPGAYVPAEIRVYSVPSGYFLSHEQVEASRRGEQIINVNDCTPLTLEHSREAPAELLAKPVPALPEDDFDDMSMEELARRAGVSLVD